MHGLVTVANVICDQRKAAALQNEPGANTILRPWLLFDGESPSAIQPVPEVASHANLNLAREFLPLPPSTIVQEVYGTLSQPQPDTAIGYLTSTEANTRTPPLATAFSCEEHYMLTNFALHPALHFPFLTCQWKPATGEPHQIAMLQSAKRHINTFCIRTRACTHRAQCTLPTHSIGAQYADVNAGTAEQEAQDNGRGICKQERATMGS
ncbi:hypothetical protein GQ44DRAFT_817805 [Phaeosphaeriaceae sp. PMI808]|nr:hypothetical protein GQ44DRAFT_817805 [Phaeosphaeriaceae sp. PMI808]